MAEGVFICNLKSEYFTYINFYYVFCQLYSNFIRTAEERRSAYGGHHGV